MHGGLRYLQKGDVRLVYEALRERQRLRHNAPHLVRLLPFLIPIFSKDGLINPKVARALGIGDVDVRPHRRRPHRQAPQAPQEGRRRWRTCRRCPEERLAGAYLYYDAAADDARLTLTIARTAALDHGAVVANHAERRASCAKDGAGRVDGADASRPTGGTIEVPRPRRRQRRRRVVRRRPRARRGRPPGHDPAGQGHPHHRAVGQGPQRHRRRRAGAEGQALGLRRAVGPATARSLTYIGTTDTDYDGPIDDPQCTPEDIDYLLARHQLRGATSRSADDVVGTWAGLRPLVKAASSGRTADLSRRHKVLVASRAAW